ncbi:MAG: UDP-N-acetylmuramate--L-alanine ligase [Chloroflexota bacterium]|nr:MAG: UDP-N-acetylmuramate--L-alanine ligase [Chloroflexota bacterium]
MPDLREKNKNQALRPGMHIHLVGIGGTGLSAVATVLLGQGYIVSGSDLRLNDLTASLKTAGATVFEGHRSDQAAGADMLLVSSAIPATNPEIQVAKQAGIPVLKRDEFLGLLMADSYSIAVAGSHGKTTTTGMIAQIMIDGDLDPSVVVGAVLPVLESNGRAGQGEFFVVEADEYDYMFLGLRPSLAIVTNVEYDHPDMFPGVSAYQQAFRDFVLRIRDEGVLLLCIEDEGAAALADFAKTVPLRVSTYGLERGEWQAVDIRPNQLGGSDFLVQNDEQTMGLVRLRVPGEHNVRNSLAAIATASELGVGFDTIRRALAAFGGLGRRFQLVGEVRDVTIVDDYAHHPTEIRATLAAARQRFPGRRLWAVWQPHTFSRTRAMLGEFANCFELADRVVALDVYQSRESDTLGIDTSQVVARMKGTRADHVGGKTEAASFISARLLPGDVVLTLGAGDGYLVGEILKRQLEQQLGQR